MNSDAPSVSAFAQHFVIECIALVVPGPSRKDWLLKWKSELWYVRREAPASKDVWKFCLGAFGDARWMRRYAPKEGAHLNLDSPLNCVMFLISLALFSLLVALLLPGARHVLLLSLYTESSFYWLHSWAGVSESPPNPIDQQIVLFRLNFVFACLILPAVTTLHLGSRSGPRNLRSCLTRSRWLVFFLLKVILILPPVYFAALDLGHLFTTSGSVFIQAMASLVGFLLSLRWAFNDQRSRCPTCLYRLSGPVRMGRPSWTLLDWNLTEYMCPKGHGVLHVPAESVAGSPIQRWIQMDSFL
jgi:hypothetical protein